MCGPTAEVICKVVPYMAAPCNAAFRNVVRATMAKDPYQLDFSFADVVDEVRVLLP